MMKTLTLALATASAVYLAVPAANAAPRLDGLTQDLSAQTTVRTTTKSKHGNRVTTKTTVKRSGGHRGYRTYAAPTYYGSSNYGYYGPTYYERPYSRPPAVVLGFGGWW